MRVIRLALACASAAIAGGSVLVQARWPAGSAAEQFFRHCGLILANDRTAEKAYNDLWTDRPGALERALRGFQEALVSDPASPSRWCDLGEAFVAAHRNAKAEYCFARAVERGPLVPSVLLRAANAYFALGDAGKALECTSRVLAIVPDYDDVILMTYDRMRISCSEVLARGLPHSQPRAARLFLQRLLHRNALREATLAWDWLHARRLADDRTADEYSSAMLKANRPGAALNAWISYLGSRAGDYGRKNYLFDGGFEHDPFGATFDWRIIETKNVHVDRDPAMACSGTSSLRIRFNGRENISYSNVRQVAFVNTPGTYLFEARVRARGITTDQGIGFRIRDAEDNRRLDVYAGNVVGTTGWVLLRKEIRVKGPTRFIDVAIVRQPSASFDSDIAGTAWVDDVVLVQTTSDAAPDAPSE